MLAHILSFFFLFLFLIAFSLKKEKTNSEREEVLLNSYFCLVAVSIIPANNKASYSIQNQIIHMLIDILEYIPIPVSSKNYC
jgi:amino acid permease